MKIVLSCLSLALMLLAIGCRKKPTTSTTPLHRAADEGNVDQIQSLIASGADINAKNERGETPLHKAVLGRGDHKSLVRLLVAHGANPNAKDQIGNTPLYKVAQWASIDVAEVLISAGADVNAKNKDGKTPLTMAIEKGHQEVVDLLRKHGGVE